MSLIGQNKKKASNKAFGDDFPLLPENNLNDKPKYERMIFNLSPELVADINDHVNNLKRDGRKEYDPIVGKYKKINLSLWARQILEDGLKKEGYVRPQKNTNPFEQIQKQTNTDQTNTDQTKKDQN